MNVCLPAQPSGELSADKNAQKAEKPRQENRCNQPVPLHIPGFFRFLPADVMGYLNGKSRRYRIGDPIEKPGAAGDQPMAADAFAPSAPTMAESMYCITMEVIWVRMAGRLSRQTSPM